MHWDMNRKRGKGMICEITSTNNPIIKFACSLSRSKSRTENMQHFIEGDKLVREAKESGVRISHLFADSICEADEYEGVSERVYLVPRHILEKICDSRTPQHICAVAYTPENDGEPFSDGAGFIVALDTVQDPGNVGTIIRTSDAFGASSVILGPGCADPFSSKVLRSSMGSVYHLPIFQPDDLPRSLSRLKAQGFRLICGHLKGSSELPLNLSRAVIVIGNEGNGVSDTVAELCELYRIPMKGRAESLNASVAASILIYQISQQINL